MGLLITGRSIIHRRPTKEGSRFRKFIIFCHALADLRCQKKVGRNIEQICENHQMEFHSDRLLMPVLQIHPQKADTIFVVWRGNSITSFSMTSRQVSYPYYKVKSRRLGFQLELVCWRWLHKQNKENGVYSGYFLSRTRSLADPDQK